LRSSDVNESAHRRLAAIVHNWRLETMSTRLLAFVLDFHVVIDLAIFKRLFREFLADSVLAFEAA
jgi:hypothetical protein